MYGLPLCLSGEFFDNLEIILVVNRYFKGYHDEAAFEAFILHLNDTFFNIRFRSFTGQPGTVHG